jgi:hypothetical protein
MSGFDDEDQRPFSGRKGHSGKGSSKRSIPTVRGAEPFRRDRAPPLESPSLSLRPSLDYGDEYMGRESISLNLTKPTPITELLPFYEFECRPR